MSRSHRTLTFAAATMAVVALGVRQRAALAQSEVEAVITADNNYSFGWGNQNGIDANKYTGAVNNNVNTEFYTCLPGDQPETICAPTGTLFASPVPCTPAANVELGNGTTFPYVGVERWVMPSSELGANDWFYLVTDSDNAAWQGVLASFRHLDPGAQLMRTGDLGWQVCATGDDRVTSSSPAGQLAFPSRADINAKIQECNAGQHGGWVDHTAGASGRLFPNPPGANSDNTATAPDTLWGPIACVDSEASWMWFNTHPDNSGSPNPLGKSGTWVNHDEFLIFRLPVGEVVFDPCTRFVTDGLTPGSPPSYEGWTAVNSTITVGIGGPSSDDPFYLSASDGSGASQVWAPDTFHGDWTAFAECSQFCFDVRITDDGASGSADHAPYFVVIGQNGLGRAHFTSSQLASEAAGANWGSNNGWHRVCAPIAPETPSSPDGVWTVDTGGPLAAILADVEDVYVPVDLGSAFITEVVDYDNFCLLQTPCPDPCCNYEVTPLDTMMTSSGSPNGYKITGAFTSGGGNVTKLEADVISSNQSFSPGCGTGGPLPTTMLLGPTTLAGSPSVLGTAPVPNGHSVEFNFSPPQAFSADPFGLNVTLPPAPPWPCRDEVTVCVRYTFTYDDCSVCEWTECYKVSRRGKIVWNENIPNAPVAQPLPVQPAVIVADESGQPIPDARGVVSLSIVPGTGAAGARLTGRTSVDVSGGRATFSNVAIDKPGQQYRLRATFAPSGGDPSLAGEGDSNPFDIVSPVAPTPTARPAGGLSNLSTRGRVGTGDDVMIGGFIVEGQNTEVVIRAIGPDLARHNVRGVLSDPVVAIHDRTGQRIALCDDWEGCQGASELGGLTPRDRREAAMRIRLDPGEYTAIVSGKDNREGVALVEVFRMR